MEIPLEPQQCRGLDQTYLITLHLRSPRQTQHDIVADT
jgi:hypothetical protein